MQASSPLRYAILGGDHIEYDMACSFHSLVASILTTREAPTLHWMVGHLLSGGNMVKPSCMGAFAAGILSDLCFLYIITLSPSYPAALP